MRDPLGWGVHRQRGTGKPREPTAGVGSRSSAATTDRAAGAPQIHVATNHEEQLHGASHKGDPNNRAGLRGRAVHHPDKAGRPEKPATAQLALVLRDPRHRDSRRCEPD